MVQPLIVEWLLDLCCAMRHRLHKMRRVSPTLVVVEMVCNLCCAMRHRLHEMRCQSPWVYDLHYGQTSHSFFCVRGCWIDSWPFTRMQMGPANGGSCCAMRYRLHDMSLEAPRVCDLAYDRFVNSM